MDIINTAHYLGTPVFTEKAPNLFDCSNTERGAIGNHRCHTLGKFTGNIAGAFESIAAL